MNAYRTAAPPPISMVDNPVDLLPQTRSECPECTADITAIICKVGHITNGDYETICNNYACSSRAVRGTWGQFCGPNKRLRHGFLWLWKCREPGTHIHQRCERCGWRGVSRPMPKRSEELK